MKRFFLILIGLFSIYSTTVYHSDEIWNKVIEHKANGKMILNNTHYFIFDEDNTYLKFTADSQELIVLNKEQKKIYDNYKLSTFIFFVATIDKDEGIDNTAQRLYNKIKSEFYVDISTSMIALVAIESRELKVAIGPSIKNLITSTDANAIINDVKPYLKEKNYYRVAKDLIEDFNYYYKLRINSQQSKGTNYDHYYSSSYGKDFDYSILFGLIGIVVFFIVIFILYIKCCPDAKCERWNCPEKKKSNSGGLFSLFGSSSNDNSSHSSHYNSNHIYSSSSGGGSDTLGGASSSW